MPFIEKFRKRKYESLSKTCTFVMTLFSLSASFQLQSFYSRANNEIYFCRLCFRFLQWNVCTIHPVPQWNLMDALNKRKTKKNNKQTNRVVDLSRIDFFFQYIVLVGSHSIFLLKPVSILIWEQCELLFIRDHALVKSIDARTMWN